ncbi:MAG: hypothetical protein H6826_14345 [Planctomycetes bacterium]|nr:hypothetical protein [Planctomycetota bacterium]
MAANKKAATKKAATKKAGTEKQAGDPGATQPSPEVLAAIEAERDVIAKLNIGDGECLVRSHSGELQKIADTPDGIAGARSQGFEPYTPAWADSGDGRAGGDEVESGPDGWPRDEDGRVVFTIDVSKTNRNFDEVRHGVQFRNGVGKTTNAQSALLLRDHGMSVSPDPLEVSRAATEAAGADKG